MLTTATTCAPAATLSQNCAPLAARSVLNQPDSTTRRPAYSAADTLCATALKPGPPSDANRRLHFPPCASSQSRVISVAFPFSAIIQPLGTEPTAATIPNAEHALKIDRRFSVGIDSSPPAYGLQRGCDGDSPWTATQADAALDGAGRDVDDRHVAGRAVGGEQLGALGVDADASRLLTDVGERAQQGPLLDV